MLLSEMSVYGGAKNIQIMIEDFDLKELKLLVKYTSKERLRILRRYIPANHRPLRKMVEKEIKK